MSAPAPGPSLALRQLASALAAALTKAAGLGIFVTGFSEYRFCETPAL
jgi:hypothetical protein